MRENGGEMLHEKVVVLISFPLLETPRPVQQDINSSAVSGVFGATADSKHVRYVP